MSSFSTATVGPLHAAEAHGSLLPDARRNLLERIDQARRLFAGGQPPAEVQRRTQLSPYLLGILSLPEKELQASVLAEADRERDESIAKNRRMREGRSA